MTYQDTQGCWTELARIEAPVAARTLWHALLDRTEHPERYNPRVRRAQVLDHDPQVVLRRIWPDEGEPFHEYVRHIKREHRVETQRMGERWCVAQRIDLSCETPALVYEVRDHHAAADAAGITAAHATRTLHHLLGQATAESPALESQQEPLPHGRCEPRASDAPATDLAG